MSVLQDFERLTIEEVDIKAGLQTVEVESLNSSSSIVSNDSWCCEYGELSVKTVYTLQEFRASIPYMKTEPVFFNCSSQILLTDLVSNAVSEFFKIRSQSPDAEFIVFDDIVEEARSLYAGLLGASDSNEICFTRDSSESLHLIQGSYVFHDGDSVVMLDNEFQHNNLSWLAFQQEHPTVNLKFVDTKGDKNYVLTAEKLEPYMDDSVKMVCLSYTMYQSGLMNDIKGIASKFSAVHVIVDLTQDVGFHEIDVEELGCSAAFFSCFKGLFVPQGLGVLYMSKAFLQDTKPLPPFMNIKGMSSFNVNTHQIDANYKFGVDGEVHSSCLKYEHCNKPNLQIYASYVMLNYFNSLQMGNVERYLYFLRNKLELVLAKYGIDVYEGDEQDCKSSNIVVTSINNPEWMKYLRSKKCIVSQFREVTRFSIGIYNNVGDIDMLDGILEEGVEKGMKFVV